MQVPKLIFNALIWITIHLPLINDSHRERDTLSVSLCSRCDPVLLALLEFLPRCYAINCGHFEMPFQWLHFGFLFYFFLLFSSLYCSVLFCSGVACLAAGRIKLQFYCSEAWKSNCYFTKSQQQQQKQQRQQLRYWATARTAPVGCVQGIRLQGP